ncbi:MAG: hypothetical protein EOO85_16525 [Pedobacter sp.]|nr:MAG: hypothetical protein EOO85_16525 [Pedobacter sp.]
MKYIFISILLLTEISYSQEKQFKNQGELEDHQAQEFFKKEYSQQNFAKFSGSIEIIDNITIKFDYKTLIIWNVDAKLLDIFSEGIFYPQIL